MLHSRQEVPLTHERRRSPRYPLVADAEIVELRSCIRLHAKTSDVSLLGCFMYVERSLPTGTKIGVQLKRHGTTFTTRGLIVRTQPMGMSVNFYNVNQNQQVVLRKWLAEISRGEVN
jgi:PilZ domain